MANVSDVKQWVRKNGVKQRWLASELGCSEKHLSLVLNGKAPLSRALRNSIAWVTGIDVEAENDKR